MEQETLIEKIEQVKNKISEFEKALNINTLGLDRIVLNQNNDIIQQISNYKKRIDTIEKDVIQQEKANYPVESKQLSIVNNIKPAEFRSELKTVEPSPAFRAKITEVATNNLKNNNSEKSGIKQTLDRVKKEAEEVEHISNMIDEIKENISSKKPSYEIVSSIRPVERTTVTTGAKEKTIIPESKIKSPGNVSYTSTSRKNPAVSDQVNITENDIHSISELISKLDELLRSNKELSDKLNELIVLQKESNVNANNSKTSELIRRLAALGANLQ